MNVVRLSAEERLEHIRTSWKNYRHPHQRPLPAPMSTLWPGEIWNEPIDRDAVTTPLPPDDNRVIHFDGSWKPPASGYDNAIPVNVVVDGDPKKKTVGQWNGNRDLLYNLLNYLHRIPLSDRPWFQGHPAEGPFLTGDMHYLIVSPEEMKIYECLSIRSHRILSPSGWEFESIVVWDMRKPYKKQADKRKGVNAAKIPMVPMTALYEEFERGVIDHAIGGALPRYLPGNPVFPAMNTDGRLVRLPDGTEVREVPVYAGQRMQLSEEWIEQNWDNLSEFARVYVTALNVYGFIPADTTARNHGSAWTAPDGRFEGKGLDDLHIPISAFRVVH